MYLQVFVRFRLIKSYISVIKPKLVLVHAHKE